MAQFATVIRFSIPDGTGCDGAGPPARGAGRVHRAVRSVVKAALAAAWLLPAFPALAQEAAGTPPVATAPTAMSVVTGLAPGDLLNVRATASPTGKVMARMPGGSALKNFGCDDVNGYKWCRVEAVEDARLAGWTPGRYLQTVELAEAIAGTAEPESGGPDERAAGAPDPTAGSGGPTPTAQAAATQQVEESPPAIPADLAARLGDGPDAAGNSGPGPQSPALTGEIYSLALNGGDAPTAAESNELPLAPVTLPTVTAEENPATTSPAAASSNAPPVPSAITESGALPAASGLIPSLSRVDDPAPAQSGAEAASPGAAKVAAPGAAASVESDAPLSALAVSPSVAKVDGPAPILSGAASASPMAAAEVSAPNPSVAAAPALRLADPILPADTPSPPRNGTGVSSAAPAMLAFCAFPVALLAFMASILSFGSFSFTSPFDPSPMAT